MDFVASHPEYDILCLIQATSPLIVPQDFRDGLRKMASAKADSLVTAVRAHRFLWAVDESSGTASAKNYDPLNRPRRQDWDGELIENGAFYMTKKAVLEKESCRLGGRIALHEMAEHTLTELDSSVDWQIVSHMVETYGYWPSGTAPASGVGAVSAAPSALLTVAISAGIVLGFLASRAISR